MSERITYLDSSAIMKRYLEESGTPEVSSRFRQAYSGEIRLSFSVWNVGEVLGALDKAARLQRMSVKEHDLTRMRFLLELQRMVRLRIADAIPLRSRVLLDSWRIIEKYHVYAADALQVAAAKHVEASEFLTGDRRLHEVAASSGLESTCLAPETSPSD